MCNFEENGVFKEGQLTITKGLVKKSMVALFIFLDNIFIRFGTKLYRQTIGIPMRTDCAPFVANLFLCCYERDLCLSHGKIRLTL